MTVFGSADSLERRARLGNNAPQSQQRPRFSWAQQQTPRSGVSSPRAMQDYEQALGGGGPPRGGARSATARAQDRPRMAQERETAARTAETRQARSMDDHLGVQSGINQLERAIFEAAIQESQPKPNATYQALTDALQAQTEAVGAANDPDSPYTYGRYEEGNYSGYRTRSDLEDVVMGRMYQLQNELGDAASQIDREASIGADRAAMEQRLANRLSDVELAQRDRQYDEPITNSTDAQRMVNARQGYRQQSGIADYTADIGDWAQGEQARLGEVQQGAQDLAAIQPSELAQYAAAELGIDPTLARGWFDEALNAKVLGRQRDTESIRETGMPYREAQQATEDATREQTAALEAQGEAMFDEDMMGRFGVSGSDLSAASGLRPEAVLSIVNTPEFTQILSDTDQQLASAGDDGGEIAQIQSDLRLNYDPVLVKLLEAIYDYRLDPDAYG